MNRIVLVTVVVYLTLSHTHCGSLSKEDDRVHTHKLSDEAHYKDTDGDKVFEHNVDYDHEAFLGKEEAEKFKSLTPEESKERLSKIVDKIDRNHDSFVYENELRIWIRQQHKLDMQKETDKRWKKINTNQDTYLTFDELIDNTIGGKETWSEEEKVNRKDLYQSYLKMMERDKKRFKAADFDSDGKLSRSEYADFLHPEESKTMRNIVIDETIEDLDKNGDGVVSLEEFVSDLKKNVAEGQDEPEWIAVEVENFRSFRDQNKDNVLDREEINNWILPTDYDHSLNEAKHLIFEADANKDGKLTKKEILDSYSLFVSSQATAYGRAIYEKEDL